MATKTKTRKATPKHKKPETKFDLYEHITDKIIALMEAGTVPWKKPWVGGKNDGEVTFNTPRNYTSNTPYNGMNWLLLFAARKTSRYWLTFKQLSERGGKIIKGSKSEIVVFWQFLVVDKKDIRGNVVIDSKTGKPLKAKVPLLKYYRVFSLDDIEGLNPIEGRTDEQTPEAIKEITKENSFKAIEACDSIVSAMPTLPDIQHKQNRAYYSPTSDYVNMPPKSKFKTNHGYYATLFHELSHSTMHSSRLDRIKDYSMFTFKGDHDYSFEELVAELSSCFLCAESNISQPDLLMNSADYISGWISKFKDDKRMLVKAAGKAQKATNFILGKQTTYTQA